MKKKQFSPDTIHDVVSDILSSDILSSDILNSTITAEHGEEKLNGHHLTNSKLGEAYLRLDSSPEVRNNSLIA